MDLRLVETAKINCAKKLFNEKSDELVKYHPLVRYHDVSSYQKLLDVMTKI